MDLGLKTMDLGYGNYGFRLWNYGFRVWNYGFRVWKLWIFTELYLFAIIRNDLPTEYKLFRVPKITMR